MPHLARHLALAILLSLPASALADDASDCLALHDASDYTAAYPVCKRAAGRGDAAAQYALGEMYRVGEGVETNYREALRWHHKAAEQGHAAAQRYLARIYLDSENYREAIKWLRLVANQGDPAFSDSAEYELSQIFKLGLGVPQGKGQPAKWYISAAERGEPAALEFLHKTCADSIGMFITFRDDAEEERRNYYASLFSICEYGAQRGYAPAQAALGDMYARGQGVAPSYRKAEEWYRKAAAQGDAYAQSSLGVMYANGAGVQADAQEAYVWLLLATSGDEGSRLLRRAHEFLEKTEKRLTPKQRAAAQEEAARRAASIAD